MDAQVISIFTGRKTICFIKRCRSIDSDLDCNGKEQCGVLTEIQEYEGR